MKLQGEDREKCLAGGLEILQKAGKIDRFEVYGPRAGEPLGAHQRPGRQRPPGWPAPRRGRERRPAPRR